MYRFYHLRLKFSSLGWVVAASLLALIFVDLYQKQSKSAVSCPNYSIAAVIPNLETENAQNLANVNRSHPSIYTNKSQIGNIAQANSCTQQNPFDESVRFALRAANLVQTAKSKEEWDEAARHWVQAVAWMQAVPPNSPKRAYAEKKVAEYMRNLAYSQQQAARSRSVSSFPSFDSELLDGQLQLYLSYLNTVGRADILIIGSSRALQGVDPRAMKQYLSAKGYRNLKIFNFGVNGATAQVVDYILTQLLTPSQLPRMVLWADGVRAFNSGRVDRTYNSIMASAGHQKLASGIRPQLTQAEPSPTKKCYKFPQPCSKKRTRSKWSLIQSARVEFEIENLSNFTQKNTQLTQLGSQKTLSNYPQFSDLMYRPSRDNFSVLPVSLIAIDANGFLPVSNRYNPNTYYQRRPYVAGRYDGDYRAFNLGGQQVRALSSVAAFTRNYQIPLVLVNLPLTDDYLDSFRWWAEQKFQQNMRRLSQQYGFIFVDLSEKALTRNDYFVDPSHLNRYGAQAVAQKLANETSIPWPHSR